MRRIAIIVLLGLGISAEASAQRVAVAPNATYSLGVYVPAAPFASSDATRAHAEALGKAIEQAAQRVRVSVQVYFRYADLVRAKPHLAILDPRCVVRSKATVLATASVNGRTSERWGLYASSTLTVPSLKGEKIVHIPSGCADNAFLTHGLLASELPLSFFGPRIGRRTASLGATAVGSAGIAKAAFLPASAAKGLTRIYDAGAIPNAALVALAPLPKDLRAGIRRAAASAGYQVGGAAGYRAFAARMKRRTKRPILARPKPYRLGVTETIEIPWKTPAKVPLLHLVR